MSDTREIAHLKKSGARIVFDAMPGLRTAAADEGATAGAADAP